MTFQCLSEQQKCKCWHWPDFCYQSYWYYTFISCAPVEALTYYCCGVNLGMQAQPFPNYMARNAFLDLEYTPLNENKGEHVNHNVPATSVKRYCQHV